MSYMTQMPAKHFKLCRVLQQNLKCCLRDSTHITIPTKKGERAVYQIFRIFFMKKQANSTSFFWGGHPERHFPNQGWNSHPLQWTCGILTTGPPGKLLNFIFIRFYLNNFKDLWMKQHVIHCRGDWSQLSVLPLNSQTLLWSHVPYPCPHFPSFIM